MTMDTCKHCGTQFRRPAASPVPRDRCERCHEEITGSAGAWPESRIDVVGQNGNDGDHYDTVGAAEILRAGLGHMEDRAATYDKPAGERSMAATVRAFAATTGIAMTEEQGWHFMALLKLVRSQQGNLRMDSYEDGAAYFGLMGEAAAKERA